MAIGMTNTPGVLEATTTTPGLMSAADKLKLDNEVLANLLTTEKRSLVGAANELYTGKASVSKDVTLCVAPDGNDTTGDGTENNPFATIQKAVNALGDVCINCNILLKAGTYNWNFSDAHELIFINKVGTYLSIKGEGVNNTIINITNNNVDGTNFVFNFNGIFVSFYGFEVNVTDTASTNLMCFYGNGQGSSCSLYNVNLNLITGTRIAYGLYVQYHCSMRMDSFNISCKDANNNVTAAVASAGTIICDWKANTIKSGMYGPKIGSAVRGGGRILKQVNSNWRAITTEDLNTDGFILRSGQ